MAGLYAANGSWNITVVDGTTMKHLYAPDRSINVFQTTGLTPVGAYHKCGALNVTKVTSGQKHRYAPDGSTNITISPFVSNGAQRVTVVSGVLV